MTSLSVDSSSATAGWREHLGQQSSMLSAMRTQNFLTVGAAVAQYVNMRAQTTTLVNTINLAANRQLEAARKNANAIMDAVGLGAETVANAVGDQTQAIESRFSQLGALIDSRLSAVEDQIRVTNLLTQNVAQLLRVPDFQKERQYYIEQGFKHYANSRFDDSLNEIALESLLKAEQLERTDYIVLHRIGMLYLYAEALVDLEKAEDYFRRAGKFAKVESSPDAVRLANMMDGIITLDVGNAIPDVNRIKALAADSFQQASIAVQAQARFPEAIDLARQAVALNDQSSAPRYQLIKALVAGDQPLEAGQTLSALLTREPAVAVAIESDPVLLAVPHIQVALQQEIKRLQESAEKELDRLREKIDPIIAALRSTPLAPDHVAYRYAKAVLDKAELLDQSALSFQMRRQTACDVIAILDDWVPISWDATKLRLVTKLPAEGRILSPYSNVVIAVSDRRRTFKVHATPSGLELLTVLAKKSYFAAEAFSQDGRLLATVDKDGMVNIWEIYANRLISSFAVSTKFVTWEFIPSWKLSPDGKFIAVGCNANIKDFSVHLWEVGTGSEKFVINKNYLREKKVADDEMTFSFSADGKAIEIDDRSRHTTFAWEFTSASELPVRESSQPKSCAMPFDTDQLQTRALQDEDYLDSAYSPDSKLYLVTHFSMKKKYVRLTLYEIPTGRALYDEIVDQDTNCQRCFEFSADGRTIVALAAGSHISMFGVTLQDYLQNLPSHDWRPPNGSEKGEAATAPVPEGRTCATCGDINDVGARFCGGCGEKLGSNAVSAKPNSVGLPEPEAEPDRHLLSQLVTKHVQALMPLAEDSKVFLAGNIPEKKLNSAIAAYAPDVSAADVLLLIDSTVFGSATDGLLLTGNQVYAHNLGLPTNMAKLVDITSAVFDNGLMIQWLDINGINFYQNSGSVKGSTVKALADWLNHYASDLRDASDPKKRHLLLAKQAS